MSTPTILVDSASGLTGKITKGNALAVGPAFPSKAYNATLGTDDVPVEIVKAKSAKVFYITGIILTGNKNISGTVDAVVELFEATADDQTVSQNDILVIPVGKSAQTVITGLVLEVDEGRFIMAKTSDDDVLVTILGYYVEAV